MTSPTKRKIDTLVARLGRQFGNHEAPKLIVNRDKATKYIVDHLKSIRFASDEELHELVSVFEDIERRNA